jgi:hypothetical protein
LYQHPHRQEPSEPAVKANNADGESDKEAPYVQAYDVYSVGVVLLELAIWKSLALQASVFEKVSPVERRKRMVEIAKAKIPPVVGSRFAKIVLRCLNIDEQLDGNTTTDMLLEILGDLDELSL